MLTVGEDLLRHRLAGKGRPARQQAVQRATQAVDVRARVGQVRIQGLLRGHVIQGPHHLSAEREPVVDPACRVFDLRQSHVEDLHHAVFVQQQVGGLDVAMNHALTMGVFKAPRRLHRAIDRLGHRQRTAALYDCRQVLAFHVFHHQEAHAVGFVGVVGRDDVRVRELGCGFRPPAEIA